MKIQIIKFGNGYMIDVNDKPYNFIESNNPMIAGNMLDSDSIKDVLKTILKTL